MLLLLYMQVFHSAKDKLFRREGYFDLLGFDFMLDDKLELYLLEVNTNPALSLDSSPVLQEVCALTLLVLYTTAVVRSLRNNSHTALTQRPCELCRPQVADAFVLLKIVH
jgi:Tubulin-tyrosine ligase family